MTPIQIILIFGILALLFFYTHYFKKKLIARLLFLCIFFAGVLAVLFPEATNTIANMLGVQRGADLLTYIMVLVFYLSFLLLYRKIDKLQQTQTEIIRIISINQVKKLGNE